MCGCVRARVRACVARALVCSCACVCERERVCARGFVGVAWVRQCDMMLRISNTVLHVPLQARAHTRIYAIGVGTDIVSGFSNRV